MLANNVQESTASTGTGNITLAGASEDGRTFTSAFATNVRFGYVIDDGDGNREGGIGYLSNSTTLVREKPIFGSASLPVNFGAGTKQVFCAATTSNIIGHAEGFSSLGGSSSAKFMKPANFIRLNGSESLSANRIYYFPMLITRAVSIDLLSARVTVSGGNSSNNLHLGIYDVDPVNGTPGARLAHSSGSDPSNAGFVSGSITEFQLQCGWYYGAIWCDVAISVRANDSSIIMHNPFQTVNAANLNNVGWVFKDNQTGLTELPAAGNADSANLAGARSPCLLVGHS